MAGRRGHSTTGPSGRPRRAIALSATVAALALSGPVWAVAPSAAQTAPPSVVDEEVTASCDVGRLLLTASQRQDFPAGATVVVTDSVTEGAATRELASDAITVPVAVRTTVAVSHPLFFRSTTGTAEFTFVRTTEVYGSAPATPDRLRHREVITASCSGPGAATVTVLGEDLSASTTSTSAPAGPTTTVAASDDGSFAAPARPVSTHARYAG